MRVSKRPLGCMTRGGLIAAVLTLVVVVGVGFAQGGRLFSPGPLNAVAGAPLGGVTSHAELANQCGACHVAPWSQEHMADRCMACHTEIRDELSDATSLHGVLMEGSGLRCRDCHTEHHGPTAPLTVMKTTRFPHEVVGFSLAAHQQRRDGSAFACEDCHGQDVTTFDPLVCESCHGRLDASFTWKHVEAFGAGCLSCHDGTGAYGKQFDHNAFFPLEGQHADLSCAACHRGMHTLDALRSTPQSCYGCHKQDDAHDGQLGTACEACHTPQGWDQATFDHAKSAFPLEGKHQQVKCEQCHVNNVFKGTPTTCVACHKQDDAHDGQLGTACEACHTPQGWDQATFDHAKSAFPLKGKHQQVKCEQCHVNNVFKGTPTTCVACHKQDDAHNGAFGTDCAACHTPTRWDDVTFDHAQTVFPLVGQHRQVSCQQCHANNVFKGTPTTCVACHADPAFHRGAFGTDCASCHTPNGWAPARYRGSHPAIADEGGSGINHGHTSCRTCHPTTVREYTCLACHSNNRGGDDD